jgi:hypothetical protein
MCSTFARSRIRAPEGIAVGSLRRVSISNVAVYDADPRHGSIISGIPYRGGLTRDQVAKRPLW